MPCNGRPRLVTADLAGLTNPVVAAAALITLLLVIVAYEAVGALVTLAHEGAHALVNTLAGRRVESLEVTGGFSGVTRSIDRGWGPGRILSGAAGYTTPPLLGLGGAALLAAGEVLVLLWTAVILILLAWIKAEKEWTTFLVLLLAAALGYVAVYATPVLQVGVAAGLVWLLLLGGVRDAVESGTDDTSDAAKLARDTLIPRRIWKLFFVAVAVLSLWGAIRLLAP